MYFNTDDINSKFEDLSEKISTVKNSIDDIDNDLGEVKTQVGQVMEGKYLTVQLLVNVLTLSEHW